MEFQTILNVNGLTIHTLYFTMSRKEMRNNIVMIKRYKKLLLILFTVDDLWTGHYLVMRNLFNKLIFLSLVTLYSVSFAQMPRLHTKDSKVVDAYNREIVLHGVNVMNKRPPHTLQSIGFTKRHMAFLESKGFNVVRLGIFWAAIEPIPGHYNIAYLNQIKQTIKDLENHHIYTLIDLHQDAYSSKNNLGMGFPEWATIGTGENTNVGFPLNYLSDLFIDDHPISDRLANNFDKFWQNAYLPKAHRKLQDAYLQMLAFCTSKLSDLSSIAGIEIMNEPFVGSSWRECVKSKANPKGGCIAFSKHALYRFTKKAIQTIHRFSPDTIVWYEPDVSFGLGDDTYIPKLNEKNIGFSFHNYAKDFTKPIQNALAQGVLQNAPVMMTEFGADTLTPNTLQKLLSFADKQQISWTYWAYANNPSFPFAKKTKLPPDPRKQGLVFDLTKPLKAPNLKADVINTLAVQYPMAVSGQTTNTHLTDNSYQINFKPNQKNGASGLTLIAMPRAKDKIRLRNSTLVKRSSGRIQIRAKSLKKSVLIDITRTKP